MAVKIKNVQAEVSVKIRRFLLKKFWKVIFNQDLEPVSFAVLSKSMKR